MLKQKCFIMILIVFINILSLTSVFANNISDTSNKTKNDINVSDISKLPEGMFYKLNPECEYIIDDKTSLSIKNYENSEKVFYVIINGCINELGDEDYNPRTDASVYLIKDKNTLHLLVDRMHEDDTRFYNLYLINNNRIDLVEKNFGKIDFVGYDYIIGYTSLGMIGYQNCEFKKVFRNGKFELDGEYKVVGDDNSYPGYPIWKFYTLVRDLEYNEYDDKTGSYIKKILKEGTKIRSLATDAKTYIEIETEDKRKGKVEVDEVKGFDNDFIVNGELFMDYYFQGDQNYSLDLFNAIPLY